MFLSFALLECLFIYYENFVAAILNVKETKHLSILN